MICEADWISADTCDAAAEFRKEFTISGIIKRAYMSVTAIGVYEAMINGRRVGDFILAPGCTAYNKRLQYQTYDVTELLSDENVLSVTVGKGWHRSRMSENRSVIITTQKNFLRNGLVMYVPSSGKMDLCLILCRISGK